MATLWRWLDGYRRDGPAGLAGGKRGPKGPSKLTLELTQLIGELAAQGKSQAAVCCCSRGIDVRGPYRAGPHPGPGGPLRARPMRRTARLAGASAASAAPRPAGRSAGRRMSCRCCWGRCRWTACGCWLGSGCLARLPCWCSRRGRGIRWPAAAGAARPGRHWAAGNGPQHVWSAQERALWPGDDAGAAGVLALLREPRAEGATRVPPAALGRVLGLDRAPEAKTIRRKLAGLASACKAADWQLAHHQPPRAGTPGRAGARYISTGILAPISAPVTCRRCTSPGSGNTSRRPRKPGSPTACGQPLLVVMAEPSDSLAA